MFLPKETLYFLGIRLNEERETLHKCLCVYMKKIAFDNEKYMKIQSQNILERAEQFSGKLYIEFGGKLFDDEHASRVLPGFLPDSKLRMLLQVKDKVEIVISISANDIEDNKQRGDFEIGYDLEVIRLIDAFRSVDLYVSSVVITFFENQASALKFKEAIEKLGVNVYLHHLIEGYPHQVEKIVSDEGFGKNEYIETSKEIVVVTAPGPASGKMATCLSQMYQEHKRGISAGYAKFETFPIHNIALQHPVNLAYEAATLDLNDVNMIDPFHLEKYGVIAINYNRDVEAFPILRAIFNKISGSCPYYSPTDMGVNMAGDCIIDHEAAYAAAKEEIVRRYYTALCEQKLGRATKAMIEKAETLMGLAEVNADSRRVAIAAREKSEESSETAFAIELDDMMIITGRRTKLLGAPAAALLNALKYLAKIDDHIPLISGNIIEPISRLKIDTLGHSSPRLHLEEVLIALSISALTNPLASEAMKQLDKLAQCECHSTMILDQVDRNTVRKLKMNYTSEPTVRAKRLYQPK